MQAVILAAGKGTRMQPLTNTIPKPMLPLRGKPKLEYTLSWLPPQVDEVIMTINHLGNQIKDYFGGNFQGIKITYVFQDKMNGTGGAVHYCKDCLDDEFLVMMGDDLYHQDDIQKMLRHELALLAYEAEDPSQFGILLRDEKGNLTQIKERPHSNETHFVNTGLYKLNKKFFDYPLVPVYDGSEYGLPQTLLSMSRDYPVAVEKATDWQPLGKYEDIAQAEAALDRFSIKHANI